MEIVDRFEYLFFESSQLAGVLALCGSELDSRTLSEFEDALFGIVEFLGFSYEDSSKANERALELLTLRLENLRIRVLSHVGSV